MRLINKTRKPERMRRKEREKEIGKGERDAVVNSVGHLFAHLLDSVAFGKFKREFSQSKTRTNETREATADFRLRIQSIPKLSTVSFLFSSSLLLIP